jgi:hypothetical protein
MGYSYFFRVGGASCLLAMSCVPEQDLGSYSVDWALQPTGGASPGAVAPDAGSAGMEMALLPALGSAESTVVVGLDLGGTSEGSPKPAAADAGTALAFDAGLVTTALLPDAAATGNAPLTASCGALGGTLEPGTRDCFLISTALPLVDWQGAVAACTRWGGSLASITSPEREAFLTGLTSADAWLGARDPAFFSNPGAANPATNDYRWLDGTPLLPYANWSLAEPDDVANQFCVAKANQPPTDPWFDRPCNELNTYVCEQTL